MILETRECAGEKCKQTFRVLPQDKQEWCSVFCRDNHEGHGWKTIKGKLAAKGSNGSTGLAEAPDQSPNGKKLEGKEKERRRRQFGGPNAIGVAESKARSTERKRLREAADTMKRTAKSTLSAERSGAKKTPVVTSKETASVMPDLKKPNGEKSMPTASNETQLSGSKELLTALSEEKSGSLKLLNDSANQLMDLASTLAKVTKDETGEAVRTSPHHNIDLAIKCFGELRNVMKTKLDYMKFGKELLETKGTK